MVQPTIQRAPRLWVALLGIAVLTAAAAFAGREIYRKDPQIVTQTITAAAPADSSAAPTSGSKVPQPGPQDVRFTQDAADHPQFGKVKQLLQNHFDSINDQNYAKWKNTVTKTRVQEQPQPEWKDAYQSTKDGNILLYRIDAAPQGRLRVLVSFTSVQDPDKAPLDLKEACIDWRVVLPLTKEDDSWRIDVSSEATGPLKEKCAPQPS